MPYTVKQLAKLSGVSVRTLHYYDQIGLLKPAYYGENQYRYYEEEQLLLLQQILFFRELDFPLEDIQRILQKDDFNKVATLKSHKEILAHNIERTYVLINTIDKTILHLEGKTKMRDKEIYVGFNPVKQKMYEEYLINSGILTQKEIDNSWEKARDWQPDDWMRFKQIGDDLNKEIVIAIQNKLSPASAEVQKLIQRHHEWVKIFWTPDKEKYLGLAKMYQEHPDFREFYNAYHDEFVDFLAEAMEIFAKEKLN